MRAKPQLDRYDLALAAAFALFAIVVFTLALT